VTVVVRVKTLVCNTTVRWMMEIASSFQGWDLMEMCGHARVENIESKDKYLQVIFLEAF
jgi:hypothetical protein